MSHPLFDTISSFLASCGEFLLRILARVRPFIFDLEFIGAFLLFTLLIWIAMSGSERDLAPSFLKAALIAFPAVTFLFVIFTA